MGNTLGDLTHKNILPKINGLGPSSFLLFCLLQLTKKFQKIENVLHNEKFKNTVTLACEYANKGINGQNSKCWIMVLFKNRFL